MKRAQIKSFETIAVLVVFFFLLVFGMSFYSRIQFSSFNKQRAQSADISVINTALKAAHLPELKCVLTGITKQNCVDILKVEQLELLMVNPDSLTIQSYFRLFQDAVVNITRLDETGIPKSSHLIYNRPNLNSSNQPRIHAPVKIYDPVSKRYDFGYIEVTVYV